MTYSIIGRDPETGQVGIAVQSRWIHAGQDLAWIEPGVGAVCTQAFLEPAYGPRGLELMRAGRSPDEAIGELTAADDGRDMRQVAMMDAGGRVAQHTGGRCVEAAGHASGSECCAQGNMLASATCWTAMVRAFGDTEGELADRLLAALDAAEREGGDARGRQAAAILVRPREATGLPWKDRVFDIQVVDHRDPVTELHRLVTMTRAYHRLSAAMDLAQTGELTAAAGEADAAHELAPEDDQILFWRATLIAGSGRIEEAVASLREAAAANRDWPEFLRRCVAAGILPEDVEPLAEAARSSQTPL